MCHHLSLSASNVSTYASSGAVISVKMNGIDVSAEVVKDYNILDVCFPININGRASKATARERGVVAFA